MRTWFTTSLLLSLLALSGCESATPIPNDTLEISFGAKNYDAAYSCTLSAVQLTGFTIKASQKDKGWIAGRMTAADTNTDMFMGTFTVNPKTMTINAKIEKLLGSNFGLFFDTKSEIDNLLNKFQANYNRC